MPTLGMAQTVLPVGSFRSITLRSGGTVTLRHAPSARVTLLKGTTRYSSATIVDGDRLVIDRCHTGCPKGYELAVEVLAPNVDDLLVMDGGTIESRGGFPRQAELRVAIEQGGTIDLRTMTPDLVNAAVWQGGRILAKPGESLIAKITGGGGVTYWGNPRVSSSVKQGGVVARGVPADADKPLEEFGPSGPAVPPVPPVPSVPPVRITGTL